MAIQEVLDLLRASKRPLPRRTIAERLNMNPKVVSGVLKRLVKSGLVTFDYAFDETVKKKIWFYKAVVNKETFIN